MRVSAARDPRVDLVADLARDEKQLMRELAGLGLADAEARVSRARSAYEAAFAELQRLEMQRSQLHAVFDYRRASVEHQLEQLADPAIDALIDDLDRQKNILAGLDQRFGDFHARARVCQALLDGHRRAEALKRTAVADLPAALAAIRRSIPTLEEAAAAVEGESSGDAA